MQWLITRDDILAHIATCTYITASTYVWCVFVKIQYLVMTQES